MKLVPLELWHQTHGHIPAEETPEQSQNTQYLFCFGNVCTQRKSSSMCLAGRTTKWPYCYHKLERNVGQMIPYSGYGAQGASMLGIRLCSGNHRHSHHIWRRINIPNDLEILQIALTLIECSIHHDMTMLFYCVGTGKCREYKQHMDKNTHGLLLACQHHWEIIMCRDQYCVLLWNIFSTLHYIPLFLICWPPF